MDYLRAVARPNILSSALPALMTAGALAALEVMKSDEGEARLRKLHSLAKAARDRLLGEGFQILGTGQLPVVCLLVGESVDVLRFASCLLEAGVLAIAFIWPAAPHHAARIRITPTALHEFEDIEALVNACRSARETVNC